MKRLSFLAALVGGGAAQAVTPSKPKLTGKMINFAFQFKPDEVGTAASIAKQLGGYCYFAGNNPVPGVYPTRNANMERNGYAVVLTAAVTSTGDIMTWEAFREAGGAIEVQNADGTWKEFKYENA